MREEAKLRMFYEKIGASKRKLEIHDSKPPKKRKVLSYYQEGEALIEFVSTVEEHHHQVFISPVILHCSYSGNGNNACKSVV